MRDGNKALAALDIGEETTFPRVIELQTTTVCNARCVTCPYESVHAGEPGRRMSDALLWRLLGECRQHRDSVSQMVPYHNNEPFADRRLPEIVAYIAAEIGAPIELSTNASLATPERAAAVIRHMHGGTLRISFFGARKQQYEERMRKLSWEKATANIEALIAARDSLCPTLKIEIVMIAAFGLTPQEVAHARTMWEPAAEVVVFGYLDRAGNMAGSTNPLPLLRRTTRVVGCDLNRPFERLNVNADGKAILCSQDWKGEAVLADLNTSTIAQAWMSPAYARVRAQITGAQPAPPDMICRSCKLAILE